MTAPRWLLAFGLFAGFCVVSLPAQEKGVQIVPVKYDELKQEILKHRGKVVVVDFWQTTCVPCVEALPRYIELQKKYADQGLVVITVSLDKADNPKKIASANRILTEIKSPLRNLILDEPEEIWAKFDVKSFPFAYVFDRRGKWVRYRSYEFPEAKAYDAEVKKGVEQFLNEK